MISAGKGSASGQNKSTSLQKDFKFKRLNLSTLNSTDVSYIYHLQANCFLAPNVPDAPMLFVNFIGVILTVDVIKF